LNQPHDAEISDRPAANSAYRPPSQNALDDRAEQSSMLMSEIGEVNLFAVILLACPTAIPCLLKA